MVTLLKPIAAALTLGSGGNGGNFAPSLFSGAYLGFWVAKMFELLGVKDLPQSNFTIVGMAGVLSGIYHAPLTAIFLIVEITGGYNLILPLMIVSSLGFIISKHFNQYAMDTRKLAKNGYLFTADKDLNILTTINLSALIETNFQTLQSDMPLGVIVQHIATQNAIFFLY